MYTGYKYVIVDCFGTLLTPPIYDATIDLFKKLNLSYRKRKELGKIVLTNNRFVNVVEFYKYLVDQGFEKKVLSYIEVEAMQRVEVAAMQEIQFYEDAEEFLRHCRSQKIKIVLASVLAPWFSFVVVDKIINKYCEDFVLSYNIEFTKDNIIFGEACLNRINTDPKEILWIDNSPKGIYCADHIGSAKVLLTRQPDKKVPTDLPVDTLKVNSLSQLLGILK